MNWTTRISKSLTKDKRSLSNLYIQKICIIAIALSISTMLVSSMVIKGFDNKIQTKIFDFWSHIRIVPFSLTNSNLLETPFVFSAKEINKIEKDPRVKLVQKVCNKGALIQKESNIEGIILRGIPMDTMSNSLTSCLVYPQNRPTKHPNDIPLIISQYTADKLNVSVGQKVTLRLIDAQVEAKSGFIVNIYMTNIEEFDEKIVLTDIHQIQKLNAWSEDSVSSIEIVLNDRTQINQYTQELYSAVSQVNIVTIQELYPQIFDWLRLMAQNETIIITIMLLVSIINIVSTLSIMLLERTKMIGLLKVLGAKNSDLRRLFFHQSISIVLKGILWGNVISLFIALVLYFFHPIALDPKAYYISYVPISIDFLSYILINFIALLVCALTIFVPLYFVSKISPIKVVEYN